MTKKKQQGPPGETNEALLIAIVFIILFLLWWKFSARIAALVLGIRLGESAIFALFTSGLDDLVLWMRGIDRRSVTASDLFMVSQKVGSYVRFITTPIVIFLGYKLYKSSPTERFRRKFTDKTLPLAQADIYPWMKISTKIDFLSMDPEKGPWAYAKTERAFAREHNLRNERGEYDREKAKQVFTRQLGPVWFGYKNLKPHAKAIFAMLAARINKDFSTSDKLLIQLANSAAEGKVDYTGVDELAAKYLETKSIKRLFRLHSYEKTVLMSMLHRARGGDTGKDYLPPNWFLWIKGMDRGLWYALSDVGRKAPHVESAGVFAHWLAEIARSKRLEMPFVDTAVDGLLKELSKLTEDGDQGIADDADLLELRLAEPKPIPTPEEAEFQRQERAIAFGAGTNATSLARADKASSASGDISEETNSRSDRPGASRSAGRRGMAGNDSEERSYGASRSDSVGGSGQRGVGRDGYGGGDEVRGRGPARNRETSGDSDDRGGGNDRNGSGVRGRKGRGSGDDDIIEGF